MRQLMGAKSVVDFGSTAVNGLFGAVEWDKFCRRPERGLAIQTRFVSDDRY